MFQIIMPRSDICYDISLSFFNHCCGKTPEETTYGKKGIAQSVRASAITGGGGVPEFKVAGVRGRKQGELAQNQKQTSALLQPPLRAACATSSRLYSLQNGAINWGLSAQNTSLWGGRSDPNHMSLLLFLDVLFVGFRTEN